MSWMEGVGPVQDVDEYGRSKGLPKHWYSNKQHKWVKRREEINKGNFWDVIDNPLFEVAAGAEGFDWNEWVADAKTKVPVGGSSEELVRALVEHGRFGWRPTGQHPDGRGGPTMEKYRKPDRYELMTRAEAEDEGYDFEVIRPDNQWGVSNEGVAADLDVMQRWLEDIISINDHLPEIIREGVHGWQYGIQGDVWEHYGLDKEPEPPKELEWDSYDKHMQLATAVKSKEAYSTPEGITPVDLHGD